MNLTRVLTFLRGRLILAATFIALSHPPSATAIILYSTGEPDANTSAPSGDLIDSGWQWAGLWGNFTGTPIAPHYFLTAAHVGGRIGDVLTLNGTSHRATKVYIPPNIDLALWQVREPFESWANVSTQLNQVGLKAVAIGRGTQRGAAVISNQTRTNGWYWGSSDGRLRWGQNQIDGTVSYTDNGTNDLLVLDFNSKGLPNECTLSGGDSGGSLFVQAANAWELAGINILVDGPFNTSTNGGGFQAAVFDARGLFVKNDTNWQALAAFGPEIPASFYCLRLSLFSGWISNIISAPIDLPPELLKSAAVEGPYTVDSTALPNTSQQQFAIPFPVSPTFYRLSDDQQTWVINASAGSSNTLILRYHADP